MGRGIEDWVVQVFVAVGPGRVVGVEVFNMLAVRPLSLYEVEERTLKGRRVKVLTLESWVASKLADPNGVDEQNMRRLERAVEKGIDEAKLLEILRRLGMHSTVSLNARSVLRRTRSDCLRRILQATSVGGRAALVRYIKVDGLRWRVGLEDRERPLVAAALYFVEPRPEEEVFREMAGLVGPEEAEGIASLVWRIAFGEGYTLEEWAGLLERLTILSSWECIWRFQELAERGLRRRHTAPPAKLRDWEVLRAACKHLGTG